MLSPLGSLIIKFDGQNPISTGAENNLKSKDEDDVCDATLHPPSLPTHENGEELDLEELISIPDTEESTSAPFSTYLTFEVKCHEP